MKPLAAATIMVAAMLGAGAPLSMAQTQAAADQTVVTVGSRIPLAADRVSGDVVVISRQDLALLGADNLADALQALAGVQVSRSGGSGQPTSVLIRGAAASNTLVLIDGVRVGSATLGQFDFANLSLSGIERIEVLRGPGSSLHGADAVGGVVLVTTRARAAADGVRHQAFASLGSLKTSDAGGASIWKQGAWDAQLQFSQQASRGVSALRPGDRFGSHNPDADGYRRQAMQAHAGWQAGQSHRIEGSVLQARLFSRYDATEYAPPLYLPDASPDFSTTTETSLTALRYEGAEGRWRWRLRLGHGSEDSGSAGRLIERYRTQREESGLQLSWQAATGQHLTLAWDQLREQARTSAYAEPVARENDAVTLAYVARLGALEVQADAREDRNSAYGAHRTGRTGLRWSVGPQTSLRLMAASTFRAPSFNELAYPGYGVPTLAPESGRSLEAGIHHTAPHSIWQASVWRNRVDRLIAYSSEPGDCPATPAYAYGCAANIGRAALKGVTLEMQWRNHASPQATAPWRLAYDGMDARDGSGQPLPRRARHQWRLQSQHPVSGWEVGSAWLWQSQRREGGVALRGGLRLDAQAQRALGPEWRLRLAVLNALGRDFEPARDYQTPSRQFIVGLRWEGR